MLEKKVEIKLRVALMLLLPAIVFSLLALAVFAQNNIEATVAVSPVAEEIECYPDALVFGSGLQWIYCWIELKNADVDGIDVNTVRLGLTTSSCSVPADPAFFFINDFDRDGIEDALVRFSRATADAACFGPPPSTTSFELLISGEVGGFQFSNTDDIIYFKSLTTQFSRYFQLGLISSSHGQIHNFSGLHLTAYFPYTLHFIGHTSCSGDQNCIGMSTFYTQGRQVVPITIRLFGANITINTFRSVQAAFRIQDYRQCFIDATAKIVDCEGNGLIVINYGNGTNFRRELPFAHFRVENFKAKIEAGNIFSNEVFINNVPVNIVRIR